MQANADLYPTGSRDNFVYEASQIAQEFPGLVGRSHESVQECHMSFSGASHGADPDASAVHSSSYDSSDNTRTNPSPSVPSCQLNAQSHTFAVASARTLGSLHRHGSSPDLTDDSRSAADDDFTLRPSYSRQINSIIARQKNHGTLCRIKTAFEKFVSLTKRPRTKRRASCNNRFSLYIGPSGGYEDSIVDVDDDDDAIVPGSRYGLYTDQPLPYSAFYTRGSLPPLSVEGQLGRSQTFRSAFDDEQALSSSHRSSFIRNLHTALLYAAHNASSSTAVSARSSQEYTVIEPLGSEDGFTSENEVHGEDETSEDDITWLATHILSPDGSPSSLQVPRMRSFERGERPEIIEENASAEWVTISRASPTTVSIRRGVSQRRSTIGVGGDRPAATAVAVERGLRRATVPLRAG
ncbi:hypothetical protein NX059_001116 [Plenodomus lindquistii]|nr:hypothetical protein NX059_001116 [Plenodomus lindquistii]